MVIDYETGDIYGIKEIREYQKEIERLNTTIQSNINSYNKLAKYSSDLEDRIDKAIEYIENTYIGSILEVHSGYEEEYTKPLLDILKGSDK